MEKISQLSQLTLYRLLRNGLEIGDFARWVQRLSKRLWNLNIMGYIFFKCLILYSSTFILNDTHVKTLSRFPHLILSAFRYGSTRTHLALPNSDLDCVMVLGKGPGGFGLGMNYTQKDA